eukprot:comp19335_c0_seq1/m.22254 comp19335_c0_seq1/g.22254  ORF comp19335_c0_seq1/g.22254 comp19335_c0_seq1/m.22254 type:complete len:219 (-) comp19335_c0_seq1:387-1043(-)
MMFSRVVVAATLAAGAQHVHSVPVRVAPGQDMMLQVGSGQDVYRVVPIIAANSADTAMVAPQGKRVVVTVTTERGGITAPFRRMLQRLLPASIRDRIGGPVRNEVSVPISTGQQGKSVVEITVTHRNTFLQVLSLFVFALSLALFAAVWCGCAFHCGPAPDGEVEFELRFGNQSESVNAQFVHAADSDDEDDEGVVVVGTVPASQQKGKSVATSVVVA